MPARRHRGIAVAAMTALLVTGCSSSDEKPKADSPSSSPSQSPARPSDPTTGAEGEVANGEGDTGSGDEGGRPTLDPKDVPVEVARETEEATDDFLERVGDELEKPDATKELKTVPGVTGAALEELRNRVAEYDASGWQVLGEPVVVRQRVVRLLENPERAVVHACIDNSAVRVVDVDGKRVPNSKPAKPRTRNIITLVRKKGAWIVTDQRPATQPNC